MIRKLRIEGYRSLRDVTWAPGQLNVLIGPNGSGKSNLLRGLDLLQDSASGNLSLAIIVQGGLAPLLWDGQTGELGWTLDVDPIGEGRDPTRESLTYEIRLRQLGAGSSYRVSHELLANYSHVNAGHTKTPMKFVERDPGRAVTFDFEQRKLVAHEGSVPDDKAFLAIAAGPFASRVVTGFRDSLLGWRIFHDLHVDRYAEIRKPAVARLEKRISADGQNLIPVLHTLYESDRDFRDDVDMAMRAAFGEDFEELTFPPAADQRVQLSLRWRSLRTAQSAPDLSDGTLRFLLLVAILANPEPGTLIAIDEPDTGLHPCMLPVVADLARQAAARTQVILTTHSPQLLDAFGNNPPTTTISRCIDGETKLSVLDGNELSRWLNEYSLGSLFRSGELEGMA
jgi:predicted ATPase